jgi:diacylglycerol kinase (ATP)
MAASRRALLLANPNSRSGQQPLDLALERLEAAGIEVERAAIEDREQAFARIAAGSSAIDMVIVCGGDGTLNCSASGILATGLPLGVLPAGTANDLARTLGLPTDLGQAADVIVAGATRTIDLGEVNGHLFFNVASIGLSAELAAKLDHGNKRRWGRLSYAIAAFKVLTTARPFRATIVAEDCVRRTRTYQVAVGNGRFYGGGVTVEATAAIDDQRLDLYSLEVRSVWKLLLMSRAFHAGRHSAWAEVHTDSGTAFKVRTRAPRSVNADGELITMTPAHFKLRPCALRVFVPGEQAGP